MTRRASSPVFVGRLMELDQLDEAFERATLGHPSLVLIAGEAGVGKSRLVAEFSARVDTAGAWTSAGGCIDLGEGGLPYAPFVEALRNLVRRLDPVDRASSLGPSAAVLGGLVPDLRRPRAGSDALDATDPAGRLARLFDAVLEVLGRLSTERPLVLVLEDLHWADGSTRDLLRFLVRNFRDESLLIIATYRSDELHRRHPLMPLLAELERADHVERLELRRFDRDELGEQLGGILGESPSPELVDTLFERSDGLPFYVEELVSGTERDGSELPSALRDILGLRLATLSPASLAVVRAAAVIGGRFLHEGLAATSGMDEEALIAALHGAIDARILVPTQSRDKPAYTFRHALLREAAYDELLPAERVRLHSRLADHLGAAIAARASPDLSDVADFAIHAHHAHDQPRALEGSVRAVHAFVAVAAYREALGHAERALELWPRVDDARERARMDHSDLLALAGRIASATRQPERATSLTKEALLDLESPADRDRRAELLAALYLFAWESRDFETAAAAVEEAYHLVETTEPSRLKALVVLRLGSHRWWEGHLRESLRLCEEAMALSLALGDLLAWTDAAAAAAHTLADLGEVARADALVDRSITLTTDLDGRPERTFADTDWSIALWTSGRFEDSARIASAGLARATRYGWEARLGSAFRGCLADAFLELGRYDDVDEMCRPVLAGAGIRHTITWAALTMTRAAVARGQLDEANRLMDGLDPDVSTGPERDYYMLSAAELARAEGRIRDVVSGIDSVLGDASRREIVMPLPLVLAAGIGASADRAVLARRRRRTLEISQAADDAGRWLVLFRSIIANVQEAGGAGPFIEATLATAEAEMTRLEGASDPAAWAVAVDGWTALGHPYQGASARFRLAEAILAAGGDRERATDALREALDAASTIGAMELQREIEAFGRDARIEIGEPGPGAPGATPTAQVLTPRERDVLRLVAKGHTNREIGDRLFISEKTVSVHVSNSMAKLGALSRYEAAASAQQLGLL